MSTRFRFSRRKVVDYNSIVYDVTPYRFCCWGWLKEDPCVLRLKYSEERGCYLSSLMQFPFYEYKVPFTKEEAMQDPKGFDKKVRNFVRKVLNDEALAESYQLSGPVFVPARVA